MDYFAGFIRRVCVCAFSLFLYSVTFIFFMFQICERKKHVWVLGVICSLDLADHGAAACFILPDCSLVQRGTTQHHVCRGGERPADPRRRQHRDRCPQLHSSYLACHLQGSVQEGEKERWAKEEESEAWRGGFSDVLLWKSNFRFVFQCWKRQTSTCWVGFKAMAWGTRPSWSALMTFQRPEETRCARTPWWNWRCSIRIPGELLSF